MTATVKVFDGLGLDEPETYVSASPHRDAFTLRMLVGRPDSDGLEAFDVLVCTPAWLADEVLRHGPQIGRHMLIVERLDIGRAQEFLRRRVEQISAPTWHEVAEKVSRLGLWEFEDIS